MPLRTAPLAIIILLTAAALYASTHPTAAQPNDLLIEARITAERQEDNRVKVALELRRGDDWSERIQPQLRYLPADSPIDVWRYSDPLPPIDGVPGRIRIAARRIPYGHVELALQRDLGDGWGDLQPPRARQLDSARYGPYRFATSSIDLVDNGPQRCRLGLILTPGDRCRLPDTRGELIVQADGVLRYPVDPYNAGGVGYDDGKLTPNDSRHYFVVPFLHGITRGESTKGVQIDPLDGGEYIILRLGRDRLHPAGGADCAAGLLIPFGHYCGMPTGYVWFIVYPEGPAHLTVPNHDLSWVSDADLHAQITPRGNVDRHTVRAAREADGWRITALEAPNPPPLPFAPTERGPCTQGMILEAGQSCADPTSFSKYWVDPLGRWGWDDDPPTWESSGVSRAHHPSGGSFGFRALAGKRWLVSRITGVSPDFKDVGPCFIDHVIYPGERCGGAFRVFSNGLAVYGRVADKNRVHETDYRLTYSGGVTTSFEFTAERQDDDGFRIVHMRRRWLELEQQVERPRGDCNAGLILNPGDACRYPEYGDLFLVRDDGSAAVGALALSYYSGELRFESWGRGVGYLVYRPLADKRQILLAVGDDTPTWVGDCTVGDIVQPGQKCRPRRTLPDLYIFQNAAFYDDTASTGDLLVEQPDIGLRLRAERQPDGSYRISQIDAE